MIYLIYFINVILRGHILRLFLVIQKINDDSESYLGVFLQH
jgi:hypothetical protein